MSTEFFNDQWRIPSNENQNKVSNYSMFFDGTNQGINLGSNFPYPSTVTDPWSVSFWINLSQTTFTIQKTVFSTYDVSTNTGIFISIRDSNNARSIQALVRGSTSSNFSAVKTNNSLGTNDWNHVVIVYNGDSYSSNRGFKIYINATSQSLTALGSNVQSGSLINSSDKYIGQIEDNSSYLTNCDLDQVTIFDYALSQDQVNQLGGDGYAFNFIPNDYIECGDITILNNLNAFSTSTWINCNSVSGSPVVLAGGNSSTNRFYIQLVNSTTLRYVSGSDIKDVIISNIIDGNFHHIAIVQDGTSLDVYLDNFKTSFTVTGVSSNIGDSFTIGAYFTRASNFFNGELTNTTVFNTGLTVAHVRTLYNNGKPLLDMSSFTSLQGWWKLDYTATFNSGTSVWSIPDASTNSNTGSSVGMNASSLVESNINGELISNPMALSPKPIAYYQLGDQSVDNGANYLVPNNSLSDFVFDFIPNDDIEIPTSYFGDNSFTVSMWFNKDTGTNYQGLFTGSNYQGGSNSGFVIYSLGADIEVWIQAPGFSKIISLSSVIVNGQWNNVALVREYNVGWSLYLNGNVSGTSSSFLTTDLTSANSSIGRNYNLNNFYFDGKISNVSVFNTALSTGNIETLYNNGAPNDISSLSPTAWYKLNASEIFNNTSTEWSVDNNAYPSAYRSSLNFNSDRIRLNSTSILQNVSSFTISTWANSNGGSSDRMIFAADTTTSGSRGLYISARPSGQYKVLLSTNGSTNDQFLYSTGGGDNVWRNIIVNWNGTSINLFIDGVFVYTQAVVNSTGNFSMPVEPSIGSQNGTTSGFGFIGEISNVQVWDSILTSGGATVGQVAGGEIATIYNNSSPFQGTQPQVSNLQGWWKLDNTTTGVQDSAGSNNGTNVGATEYAGFVNGLAGESSGMTSANLVVSDLQQTSGYSPYALSFDGLNDYLTMTSTDFKGSGGTVSYSFWVKPNTYAGTSNYGYFISDSSTGGGMAYSEGGTTIGTTPGQIYLYNMTTAGALIKTTSTFIDQNVWNNIVIVFNTGNIVQFYKNGVISSTLTGITSFNATWDTIAARSHSGEVNNYLNGSISNFTIFDTALTSTQVTEVYNEGRPSDLHNFSTAPVAWWQLGSNSSFNTNWTCLDEIGTNNAVSVNMSNNDIVDGVGYSASGLGTSSIDIIGDAPYSTANGLSENMDVLDRTTDVPS